MGLRDRAGFEHGEVMFGSMVKRARARPFLQLGREQAELAQLR
jgi:hypothetical protein